MYDIHIPFTSYMCIYTALHHRETARVECNYILQRGIPLIHAVLFSRLHYQLRKLYWRHVTCSDTELVTPEENGHLIFDYQPFNANIIWHLSSCIAIIRNKTMYFKQRCIKDIPQCNTVKLDYGESLGFSLSEIR